MNPQTEISQGITPDFRERLKLVDPELVRVLRSREDEVRILQRDRHGINSPDYKAFHGEDPQGDGHINRVADRNVLIMQTYFDAIGPPKSEEEAKEREEMLVFAHYFGIVHDTVQNGDFVLQIPQEGKPPLEQVIEGDWKGWIGKQAVKRKRRVRVNEQDTIDDEVMFMDQHPDVFTKKHRDWLQNGLIVTIPGWDVTGATVFQPELAKVDPALPHLILIYSTAWADLKGGTFMDGYEEFFKEGDLNLLEDYPDILEVSLHPENYTDEVIENMGKRIRKWRADQVPFTEAQWKQLQGQVVIFPAAELNLRQIAFKESTYQETHQKVKERAKSDEETSAPILLNGLRQLVLAEQAKYPRAA